MRSVVSRLHGGEEGHAAPLAGTLIAAVGSVVLAIGAANDNDGAAIAGGIVLAVGLLAATVIHHVTIEWDFYRRLSK